MNWSKEKIIEYSQNPLTWLTENFDIPIIHPWQKTFFSELAQYNCFAIRSGNGVGKTSILALAILWLLSTHPLARIQCSAPSEPQLFQGLWAEIAKWLRKSENLRQFVEWTQTKIYIKDYAGEWWAIARTSNPQPGQQSLESLQGVHEEYTMGVLDECSGIDDSASAALVGLMATGNAKLIIAGNPIRRSGFFYDAFTRLQSLFRCYVIPANDYSLLDERLINKQFVETIRVLYGEHSPAWFFKVLGEFPPEDSYRMFNPEDLEALYDPKTISEGPVYIGADISDGGDCESVFTVRQGNVLLEQRAFSSLDPEANSDALEMLCLEYKPQAVNIDGIGVGSGVVSILRRRGYSNVHSVKGNESPKNKLYLNVRSELYFNASILIRKRKIKIRFPGERLKSDLIGHYQEIRDDGVFAVTSKLKLRKAKHLDLSPDYSDSFVYSLYGDYSLIERPSIIRSEQQVKFLEMNENLRKSRYNNDWQSELKWTGSRISRFDF